MPARRSLLVGAAAIATTPSLAAAAPRRATYLLVHGAWHGGWCWREVRRRLETAGARVFTPTLTGLGERAHLFTPEVGLETHIRDVTSVIEAEELEDVVLCGHSFAGMVITGVCDRLKPRIRHVVYLDAALPRDGQSMVTHHPRPDLDTFGEAGARGMASNGLMRVPPDTALFGVPPASPEGAWLRRRLTPMPLKPWLDAIRLANGGSEGLPRTYVQCLQSPFPTSFSFHAQRLRSDRSWRLRELQSGHDAMVTAPDATAALLQEAAAVRAPGRRG